MASFFIPLTGLEADSTALNTIANDLSNMNTTGFKAESTNFSDLFYQQIGTTGSGDPIQVGAGTEVANNEINFTNGTPNSTGVDTDVALQGSGFFIVGNGQGGYELSRAGNFSLDANGNLVTSSGMSVMGYPAANGVVNTNAPVAAINIPENGVEAPSATTNFGMTAVLDSQATIGSSTSGYAPVYDSLGNEYQATVTYTKTGTNAWSYSVTLPDTLVADSSTVGGVTTVNYNFGSSGGTLATVASGTDLTITGPNAATGVSTTIPAPAIAAGESVGAYATALQDALNAANITATATASANGQLTISGAGISTTGSVIQNPIASANASGSLTFDANGNLVSPAANVGGITFSGLGDGAATMNMTWNLFGANGAANVTQVDQASAISNYTGDGYASGTYSGFTIGSDGTVTVTFSNGQKLNVGQVALGNVANLQGLQLLGDGDYAATRASGTISIGASGADGLGTMQDGALEASNVNISNEFSDLIIAQRAFEANAKSVTTFDTVTQDTINMVH